MCRCYSKHFKGFNLFDPTNKLVLQETYYQYLYFIGEKIETEMGCPRTSLWQIHGSNLLLLITPLYCSHHSKFLRLHSKVSSPLGQGYLGGPGTQCDQRDIDKRVPAKVVVPWIHMYADMGHK